MSLWGKIGEKCDHSNKKRKEVCPAAPGISVPGCLHRAGDTLYTRTPQPAFPSSYCVHVWGVLKHTHLLLQTPYKLPGPMLLSRL